MREGNDPHAESPEASATMTGPWFVTYPTPQTGREYTSDDETTYYTSTRHENEGAAMAEAERLVRAGHTAVFVGRGIFKLEIPVHATVLIERKPEPTVTEDDDE